VGTLSSELKPLVAASAAPRVYADANLPWAAVAHMRQELRWDVLFVLEHPDLRRATDREHFERARELGRTLITLDRDFEDARRFPPALGPGIVICTVADERVLRRLLQHVDRALLRPPDGIDLPLAGRTLSLTVDALTSDRRPSGRRRRRR
jgi:hypothetical protein